MSVISPAILKRYTALQKEVARLRRLYHFDDALTLPDELLDSLKRELTELENQYPELKSEHSQSSVVVGGVKTGFSKITHQVRQWSFNDIFTAKELAEFNTRIIKANNGDIPEYVVEDKIDGLKIILTYQDGNLISGATRGDGVVGEDVTLNIKTIGSIPIKLSQAVSLVVEGEAFITVDNFNAVNQLQAQKGAPLFANPRNLTAGTIRQLDSAIAKERCLSFFAYEIANASFALSSQVDKLKKLLSLGFTVNQDYQHCSSLEEVDRYYQSRYQEKKLLPYWTDGVVIKVNNLELQKQMGYTGKAPRFAVAYKFPAELATAQIKDIVFQVGRTGVITPVAELSPTVIAGTTVSRATLHNQDYIQKKDVRINDTVTIRKAGEIIPEVVDVLIGMRTEMSEPFIWPQAIPECGGDGSIERIQGKSAWRCVNRNSFTIQLRKFTHFASKSAFDIEGCGVKTVKQFLEHGIVSSYEDLFTLQIGDIIRLEGWKEKSAANLLDAIKARKTITLSRLLVAISIDGVGEEVALLLSRQCKELHALRKVSKEDLEKIHQIGAVLAHNIVAWFSHPQHNKELDALLTHITIVKDDEVAGDLPLANHIYVITGSFDDYDRDVIKRNVTKLGAKITETVSSKTTAVFVGDNPGSKYDKAVALGIPIKNITDLKLLFSINDKMKS
ncbi:MAG: NAD-dependent DNA ligase LigA [Methylacidiphilales bacterium]|nr:NAD-dependent DNA ligase LigA [Candidatus Methylacidiphilales bacterium]